MEPVCVFYKKKEGEVITKESVIEYYRIEKDMES
jgi:hypothetical protein